ncbi:MAG: hypothetical protein JWQ74_2164 [Marmoricola sp.]|nr:hypothetical protein [Marmoricola sp.]
MSARTHRWRITLLAGVGFFALQLGWLLAIAPGFGIDEFDHAFRASSVAEGHWGAGTEKAPDDLSRGELIPVRADLVPALRTACQERPYTVTYDCEALRPVPGGEVLIASGAARYNPSFYAVVGTVAKPFHGTANLIALRVATALIACVLFMLVAWLTVAGAASLWPLVALFLAALPTTVYSTAIASPNGIEMVAGLGVWVAASAVVGGCRLQQRRSVAYGALGLFAVVMVNAHTLGAVWLALSLMVLAVVHGPLATLRALLPRVRAEAAVAALSIAGIGFEVAWVLTSKVNDPSTVDDSFAGSPVPDLLRGIVLWPLQAIGAFPMRNNPAPVALYALVLALAVAFLATGLRRTGLRNRTGLALALVLGVSYAVPAALTAISFHTIGAAWQGRYGVPFSIGVLVILGCALDQRPAGRLTRPFAVAVAVGMPVAQVIGQLHVVDAQNRTPGLVAGTHWAVPSTTLLVALVLLAAACWSAAVNRWTPPGHTVVPAAPEPAEATPAPHVQQQTPQEVVR